MPNELEDRLIVARRVARKAAEAIAELYTAYQGGMDAGTSQKGEDGPVTKADYAANQIILTELGRAFPKDAILSEESPESWVTSNEWTWMIDPLDGTTNYLYRFPGFGVSIAAEVLVEGAWRVVAGAVVDVVHDARYSASLGGGATCNGAPISVSGQDDLSRALVATGFSYEPDRRRRQAEVLTRLLPRVRDIRRMGAAAVDLCMVACGRVDAFYEKGLAAWDHSAGALVAQEAGALVGDLDGGPPGTGFVLAASPAIFEPLRAILDGAGAGAA